MEYEVLLMCNLFGLIIIGLVIAYHFIDVPDEKE